MTTFGQLIIGPPGSGKTTYCCIMQEFMQNLNRNVIVVNMDPANENLTYKCDINIRELINLEDVMFNLELGPNGGLVYAIEYIEKNFEWLQVKLEQLLSANKTSKKNYVLFDFPGQIELYTHHNSVRNFVNKLSALDYRLCVVNLVDSYYCTDASKFVSVLLTSLNMMVHIEMPHINVLSKMDLIEQYGKLDFNLDFYTEVMDLNYLLENLEAKSTSKKFSKLNKLICGLVEEFSLVYFLPMNIQKKENLSVVLDRVDQANGYIYGNLDENNYDKVISNNSHYQDFMDAQVFSCLNSNKAKENDTIDDDENFDY